MARRCYLHPLVMRLKFSDAVIPVMTVGQGCCLNCIPERLLAQSGPAAYLDL